MKINYVMAEDWEGIYVDGVLEDSGHSIQVRDLLDILERRELLTYKCDEIEQEYMERLSDLPRRYENIDKSKIYD